MATKKTIKRFYTTAELLLMMNKRSFIEDVLAICPNNLGINLCSLKGIEFEAEDDEYGQLVSMKYKFMTQDTSDEELQKSVKDNGGPWPWLVRNKETNKIEFEQYG